MESTRNLPARFGGIENAGDTALTSEFAAMAAEAIAQGIDPLYVGELVREGIENDWAYIFTDTQFEPDLDERFANIKRGFDLIRGRVPVR
jgi:hypothetical protein